MKFVGKRILIISPEAWGTNKLSKHHYAEVLASLGNEVTFARPANPNSSSGAVKLIRDKVQRGLTMLPGWTAKNLMKTEVNRLEKQHGPWDLVWSFDNSRLFYLDLFQAQKKIAHIMDFDMDYQTAHHASSADLCFGVTTSIVERLRRYNSNSFLLEHGLRNLLAPKTPNEILEGDKIALYIGNLLIKTLNRKLVLEVVKSSPETTFHFIGSVSTDNLNDSIDPKGANFIHQLQQLSNTHLHGAQPAESLAGFIQQADWCWLAYNTKEFPEQTANSHKILEYLAQGKNVFCTPMKAWTGNEMVTQYSSAEELMKQISKTDFNKVTAVEARTKFAQTRTYEERIREVEHHLNVD